MIRYNDNSYMIFFLGLSIPRQKSRIPLVDLATNQAIFASIYAVTVQKEIGNGQNQLIEQPEQEDWIMKELTADGIDFGLGPGRIEVRVFNGEMPKVGFFQGHNGIELDEDDINFINE